MAFVWYYVFRFVSDLSGLRDYVFGLRYFPGYSQLAGGVSYYRFFSVFTAIYLGLLAGDLAWRCPPDRWLFTWTLPPASTSVPALAWNLWVSWLALYRLSEWIYLMLELASSHHVGSLADSYLSFLPFFATSISCIPVSYWLLGRAPKTRQSSILGCQAASLLIPILATPLLVTGGFLAFVPLAFCIGTANAAGFVWGWIAGELRWRSLQLRKTVSAAN
jgi:hypothetical protein